MENAEEEETVPDDQQTVASSYMCMKPLVSFCEKNDAGELRIGFLQADQRLDCWQELEAGGLCQEHPG